MEVSRDLRVSDDAESKRADFWLEQIFEASSVGAGPLLDLYPGFDVKKLSGMRVQLSKASAALLDADGKTLKSAPIPALSGEHVLGVMWRRGELSIWCDQNLLMSWAPPPDTGAISILNGPSAAQILADGVKLGARRAIALSSIKFDDSFMRDSADGAWKPLYGRWELTAMTFPERSANPFSLRTSFGADKAADDPFFSKRIHDNYEFGLGVVISPYEGTLHIARITGGSPAQRAGLAEDDIFLEIDGQSVESLQPWQAYQLLLHGYTRTVDLKILRPGEKTPRKFTINREHFRWGTPVEGTPILPVHAPERIGSDSVAMIVAGEPGWSDYAAEVAIKPLGSGGVGLAVAYLSPKDYLLFRWRGPTGRNKPPIRRTEPNEDGEEEPAAPPPPAEPINPNAVRDRLELVRVVDGQETILAEQAAGYRPYEFYRMGIDWSGDKVRCLLDGNEIFSANVPNLRRGQIALYALKGEPVFFDDVHIAADRERLNVVHAPERKLNSIFVFEDDMEVWANPALEWQRDLKTGWAVHRARFPGNQALVINKPKFKELHLAFFCSEKPEDCLGALTIKDGRAEFSGNYFKMAAVPVGKGPFQRIVLRASPDLVEAEIDGVRISAATAIPKDRPSPNPPGVAPYDRVAIRGLTNLGNPNTVRVTSSNTMEYTFDTSPTDWKVECGRWGLLNKWICDPRWSWFGGRTKTLASLWNKYVFSGDISIDAHVALMMQKEDPPYERPGDYNIAFCGDGVNLDSGYTLIFGGDNNSWTRLYRKGKMVAESWKEDHRLFSDRIHHPDKPQLHQRWFHLKLEKIGNKISFYRDDMLAFEFTDPEPINEGRVAFWTLDNGFLLSRVRIAHGGMKPAPFESRRSNLYEDNKVINMYDGEVFSLVQPENLPDAIKTALDAPGAAFKPAEAPAVDLPPAKPANGNAPPAYRVTNGTGGGPFILQWKSTMIDIDERSVVRFAYRIDPGAMVDLYLIDPSNPDGTFNPRQNGAFRWRMTGPAESDEFTPLAGEIPGVVADGKWHAVQVDLNPSWRALWQARGFKRVRGRVMRLVVGNLDNHGYLLAGMNGNHQGACYSISDVAVLSPANCNNATPRVSKVIWPFDAEGDGRSIGVQFEEGGSGIADESIVATLNGIAISPEMLDFDFRKQRLNIDLVKLNFPPLTPNQKLSLALLGFEDRAHNASKGAYSATTVYTAEVALKAAHPVDAPTIGIEVAGGRDVVPGASALTLNDVTAVAQGSVPRLEESSDAPPWAPAGQKRSIRVVSPVDGTTFGFQLGNVRYDLRHWPYVQLEYKIPPEMPCNLHFFDQSSYMHAVYLTDIGDAQDPFSQNVLSRSGPPEGFSADGTWRKTLIPLEHFYYTAKLTQGQRNPDGSWNGEDAQHPEITGMTIHDHGWRGNRKGMEYWIHRVQPVPAGRSSDFTFNWMSSDITGSAEYAVCVDDQPLTDPIKGGIKKEISSGETLDTALLRANRKLKDGANYIHVRVKTSAGLWSEPAHRLFFLDNTAPQIVKTEPARGTRFAGQTIKFFLKEDHGIDFRSIRLTVNGKAVVPTLPGLSYDPESNTLVYDAVKAGDRWPDGQPVNVEIQEIRDALGNGLAAPYSFSFSADRGVDRVGPEIAQIRWVPPIEMRQHRQIEMETSFNLDFEEHIGHVHPIRDCTLEWLAQPTESAYGEHAIRLTALEDDADVQIMMHKNPWYIDRLPTLQFDYKIVPGFNVDLLVEVLGEWMSIRFTGDGAAPEGGKAIGRIDQVVADGHWRHASVDLRALIDAAKPDLPVRIVNKIIFSAQGRPGCKRGSTLVLDNFDMAPAEASSGHFEWNPTPDPSGAEGYSTVLDQDPSTVAPARISRTENYLHVGPLQGIWYLHVSACNQAGNWGPTRTMRVDFGK